MLPQLDVKVLDRPHVLAHDPMPSPGHIRAPSLESTQFGSRGRDSPPDVTLKARRSSLSRSGSFSARVTPQSHQARRHSLKPKASPSLASTPESSSENGKNIFSNAHVKQGGLLTAGATGFVPMSQGGQRVRATAVSLGDPDDN